MRNEKVVVAVIARNDSPSFPFVVRWKIEGGKYSNVFATAEQAKNYIRGRYGKIRIIDRTQEAMPANKKGRK